MSRRLPKYNLGCNSSCKIRCAYNMLLKLLVSVALLLVQTPIILAFTEAEPDIFAIDAYAILQVMVTLLIITILIVATVWIMKRNGLGAGYSHNGMKVVAALSVGGRDRIIIVQAGSQQIMLGVSPGNINYLKSFDESIIPTNEPIDTSTVQKFRDILKRKN